MTTTTTQPTTRESAMQQLSFPVGPQLDIEHAADVRTPKQRETVRRIIESGVDGQTFAYALNNAFTAEVGSYRGPFKFLWADDGGDYCATVIGVSGRILRHVTSFL